MFITDRIGNLWHTHKMECYTTMKMNHHHPPDESHKHNVEKNEARPQTVHDNKMISTVSSV